MTAREAERLFQVLWTKAVGTPRYTKSEWSDLGNYLVEQFQKPALPAPAPTPDRVTVLEKNLAGWLRTATLGEIIVILECVRHELIWARSGTVTAGMTRDARAAGHVGEALDLLRAVAEGR